MLAATREFGFEETALALTGKVLTKLTRIPAAYI
jgi:hypothetical protein